MENSDKPGDVSAPRKTLKLKLPAATRPASASKGTGGAIDVPAAPAAVIRTPGGAESRAPAPSAAMPDGRSPRMSPSGPPPRFPRGGPRAHETANWADEHKRRMQADMDALGAGDPNLESGSKPRSRR